MLPAFLPCLYQDRSRRESPRTRPEPDSLARLILNLCFDCAGSSRARKSKLHLAVSFRGASRARQSVEFPCRRR